MYKLTQLLIEQNDKLSILRTSIIERKPITINYVGPSPEVLSGERFDIEPVVMGTNAKSGNLVIWAYVFRGASKKGLPGWKMFRVDRIQDVSFSDDINSFSLADLPGYEKGKADHGMKSLSRVDIFSPYWKEEDRRLKKNKPVPQIAPVPAPEPAPEEEPIPEPIPGQEPQQTPTYPVEKPELSSKGYDIDAYNELKTKVKDIRGEKVVSKQDYDFTVKNLYDKKQGEWKNYQQMVSGSNRPGEGTRKRFEFTAKSEIDKLLSKDNIKVSEINGQNLSEMFRRFKSLINS